MKLRSLKIHGFSTAFPGLVDLPLATIEPGLVAIVGGNGAGKTTILDAVPGAIFRKLPSRDGLAQVDFATARDAFLDLEYQLADQVYRSRVNLDAQARKTDAVLERVLSDGQRSPLNNGQASTYDKAIAGLFPSFDLFLNSAFAAQGRGDEFTRATPSKRKDLFAEFLSLRRLLTMAKTAGEAVALCEDACRRNAALIEALEHDTAPGRVDALEQWAADLVTKGEAAAARERVLSEQLAILEARMAVSGDASAMYASAQLRVHTLEAALRGRQQEQGTATRVRESFLADSARELQTIRTHQMDAVRDLDHRIAGNQTIQAKAAEIRQAVVDLAVVRDEMAAARLSLDETQAARVQAAADLSAAHEALQAFLAPRLALTRAQQDRDLLSTVPCGGAAPYAACQFLTNATAAAAKIADLEAQLAGAGAAEERRAALQQDLTALDLDVQRQRATLLAAEAKARTLEASAKYEAALNESESRVRDLAQQKDAVLADADRQHTAAAARHAARLAELDDAAAVLTEALATLRTDLEVAQHDLKAAATGNSQAAALAKELAAVRLERDAAVRLAAEVESGRGELARRREEFAAKRDRLADLHARRGRLQEQLLDWTFFAKALGKGGLPDLEIDAAGPSISALTNALLLHSYGPRFSLELVTQVEKADGSGMRDEFTVRVLDNESAGDGWRDISELSGGEKVVVQEALMCAIAVYVNERSPHPIRTLFRDETGAALDPANAIAYVQMLRKVRELGGFQHCFYVSHNPDVYALADTQIRVADGQARIVEAPFMTEAA